MLVLGLDEGELSLETRNEGLFFFNLILSFFNEVSGSLVDVVRILHTKIEGIKFATNGEDALSESVFVLLDDLLRDI